MQVWKLSPSDLTFLWDECRRCFYLKVVSKFNRPRVPFPGIFGKIDRLMNAYFMGKPSSAISPDLPDGEIAYGEKWVHSTDIRLPNHEHACYIRGRFDTAIRFNDGDYAVIDFKTTQPAPHHVEFYGRQLHAYAYALENPAPNGLALSPITHLGLLSVTPSDLQRFDDGRIAYLGDPLWTEVPKDMNRFLRFIDGVLSVLELPEPPDANPQCGFCDYRQRTRMTEW
jgi:hypothetical protein